MPKKILLIENDPDFAGGVSETLEASGFDVRSTGEGKDGLDLAREWGPEAIVLCVELPGMSGYLVCQKLRKDDALKGIPLVLTSAEATADTFEKHRALKVRADAYLLKPFAPTALLEVLAELIGLPEPSADAFAQEELVSLDEELGIETLPVDEPDAELSLDLGSLPEEDAPAGAGDEDLALLDDAFDGLSAPAGGAAIADEPFELDLDGDPQPSGEPLEAASSAGDELDLAEALLGDQPETPRPPPALDEEDTALGALGSFAEDAPFAERGPGPTEPGAADGMEVEPDLPVELELELEPELGAPRAPVRGASADLLRAAGIRLLADEPPARTPPPAAFATRPAAPRNDAVAPPRSDAAAAPSPAAVTRLERELAEAQRLLAASRDAIAEREGELRQLRARADDAATRADDAARRAEDAEAALSERDVELAAVRARADAAAAQARRLEGDLKAARDEARRAGELERRLQDAERRAEAAEARAEDALAEVARKADALALAAEATGRAEALDRELEDVRNQLHAARGATEGAQREVESRTEELQKRVADLEALNSKNEERILKAYMKIKSDEKAKDKVRKALAIAVQLLEEGLPAETAAEKDRRTAAGALLGRE